MSSRRELAALLGCGESTLYRWLKTYSRQGLSGLLKVTTSPSRPPQLTQEALEGLREQLQDPEGFSSYGEVQAWLEQHYHTQAAYSTVHGIVR